MTLVMRLAEAGQLRRMTMMGIVVAALGLTIIAGLGRLPGGPLVLGGAIGALVGVVLMLGRLEFGLLLLPAVAVLAPFGLGTGTATTLVASLLLAACLIALWLARMLAKRDLRVVRSPINLPLAGFVGAACLATLSSQVFRDPLVLFVPSFPQIQLGGLSVFIISAGLFVVAMNCLRTARLVTWLTWIMIGLGTVTLAAYLLLPGGDPGFVAIGGLFSLWVVSLAVGQALFNQRLAPVVRLLLLALAGAWLARRLFVEIGWFSGWLPILVSVATIVALRSWRLLVLGVTVAALVVTVNWGFFAQAYDEQVSGQDSQGNEARLDVWDRAVTAIHDQWLLGLGPVGYAPYYMTYAPDDARSSHSNYVDILAQTGVVGSFFFGWFLVALGVVGVQARRRWPTGLLGGFASGALGGLIGMTVAMALGDWVIPFVYNQTIAGFRFTMHSWLILGTLAALPHLRTEKGAG